jgi:hypothetical protein
MRLPRSSELRLHVIEAASVNMSHCFVAGASFSSAKQRMRWCISVCLPELRVKIDTPFVLHALQTKRQSNGTGQENHSA